MSKALIVGVGVAVLLSVLGASGCAGREPRGAVVIEQAPKPVEDTSTITPLERGRARRDAMDAAEKAIAAFLADDEPGIKKYWAEQYQKLWKTYRAQNAENGVQRVRKHSNIEIFDVVEMGREGKDAIVQYRFTDESVFKDASGKVVAPPANRATEFQLTMAKRDDGTWYVKRLVAGDEFYK